MAVSIVVNYVIEGSLTIAKMQREFVKGIVVCIERIREFTNSLSL